jgi:hypothetical protein
MSIPFAATGPSGAIAYADDSTEVSISNSGATHLMCVNPDTANVVVVSAGFTDGDVDAIVPDNNFNGQGIVIAPFGMVILSLPQKQYATGNIFVSVAGVSGTGTVYITPGTTTS